MKIFLRWFISLYCLSQVTYAADINLAWDASTSANVGGYKLYYGQTSGNYTSSVDVGNVTSYKLTGLADGVKYFIALKSYDNAKTKESAAYSNEVSGVGVPIIVPPPTKLIPLVIKSDGTTITSNNVPSDATCNVYKSPDLTTGYTGNSIPFAANNLPVVNGVCSVKISTYFPVNTKGLIGLTYSTFNDVDETNMSNILAIDTTPVVVPPPVVVSTIPVSIFTNVAVNGVTGELFVQSWDVDNKLADGCTYSIDNGSFINIPLTNRTTLKSFCKMPIKTDGKNHILYYAYTLGTAQGKKTGFSFKSPTCN